MPEKNLFVQPRLWLRRELSTALKEAARAYDKRLRGSIFVRSERVLEHPLAKWSLQAQERMHANLRRILNSPELTEEWPKLERVLRVHTDEQKVWMYKYLLSAMVSKAPSLPKKTDKQIKKEWDNALVSRRRGAR